MKTIDTTDLETITGGYCPRFRAGYRGRPSPYWGLRRLYRQLYRGPELRFGGCY